MKKGILVTLMLLLNSTNVFSCDQHGTAGIVEDNNLWIGTDAKSVSTVDEKTFNKILDDVVAIYAPIIAEKGKTLDMIRKWDDGTVNAYAQQTGNTWKVSMFGGLARHEAVTDDAFALVVCHEVGHHIGGAPKISSSKWASNEGQADYFGTLKCFRRTFRDEDNVRIMANINIPDYVTEKCKAEFPEAGELALCQRAALAGKSLAKLLGGGRGGNFNTPDGRVVDTTNDRHPAAQCRLDTYFQGALCDKDIFDELSSKDPIPGSCARVRGRSVGVRPLCWFKPKS